MAAIPGQIPEIHFQRTGSKPTLGMSLTRNGVYDIHLPECFKYIHCPDKVV
jgi:hypothetical protein